MANVHQVQEPIAAQIEAHLNVSLMALNAATVLGTTGRMKYLSGTGQLVEREIFTVHNELSCGTAIGVQRSVARERRHKTARTVQFDLFAGRQVHDAIGGLWIEKFIRSGYDDQWLWFGQSTGDGNLTTYENAFTF